MARGIQALCTILALALSAAALAPLAAATTSGGPPPIPPGLGRIGFNNSSGDIVGSFVRLDAPDAADIIENFESDGLLYFDAIAVSGYEKQGQEFIGSLLNVRGVGAEAQVHDNPVTIIKLTLSANATADFDFASGVTGADNGNNSVRLTVDGSNRTGFIWWACPNGTVALAGDNASLSASATNTPCIVFFRSHIDDPAAEAAIGNAAASGRLAAEVFAGRSAEDGSDVTTYGSAMVVVVRTPGRITISIDTNENAPTSVLVRFVPGEGGRAQVTVDGRAVTESVDLEDSLDASDDAQTEYSLTPLGNQGLLVISLPRGGAHLIEVADVAGALPSANLATSFVGAALGLTLAAVAALVLLRRR
jgi:hypothetical protein